MKLTFENFGLIKLPKDKWQFIYKDQTSEKIYDFAVDAIMDLHKLSTEPALTKETCDIKMAYINSSVNLIKAFGKLSDQLNKLIPDKPKKEKLKLVFGTQEDAVK